MGAKVVTLLLGPDQVSQLEARYPGCVLNSAANTEHLLPDLQEYRVMVPGQRSGDSLYDFLVDTMLAVSSTHLQPARLPWGNLWPSWHLPPA